MTTSVMTEITSQQWHHHDNIIYEDSDKNAIENLNISWGDDITAWITTFMSSVLR